METFDACTLEPQDLPFFALSWLVMMDKLVSDPKGPVRGGTEDDKVAFAISHLKGKTRVRAGVLWDGGKLPDYAAFRKWFHDLVGCLDMPAKKIMWNKINSLPKGQTRADLQRELDFCRDLNRAFHTNIDEKTFVVYGNRRWRKWIRPIELLSIM